MCQEGCAGHSAMTFCEHFKMETVIPLKLVTDSDQYLYKYKEAKVTMGS
jgi:hypothetical protein